MLLRPYMGMPTLLDTSLSWAAAEQQTQATTQIDVPCCCAVPAADLEQVKLALAEAPHSFKELPEAKQATYRKFAEGALYNNSLSAPHCLQPADLLPA